MQTPSQMDRDDYGHERVRDDVLAAARTFNDEHSGWAFEYEIPTETAGWVYGGDGGSGAVSANWYDVWPDPNEAVSVHTTPTHPQDETPDKTEVAHVHDMDSKVHSREVIESWDHSPYRSPLYEGRKYFWMAVEKAIGYMEDNPVNDD